MRNDDEIRRLQRLREQQISKRIPVIKSDKQLSRAATRRKDWSKYTLADAMRDMPAKWLYDRSSLWPTYSSFPPCVRP